MRKKPRFDLVFAPICPVHAPYCPGFASQTPRFASHAMERRGWIGRFPAKFGTGFACRGEGGFNAEDAEIAEGEWGTKDFGPGPP